MRPKDLLWVAANPVGQTPKEARTQIRQQVMKAAVEAKRRKLKKPGVTMTTDTNSDKGNAEDQHESPALVPKFIRGKLVLTFANDNSSRQRQNSDSHVPAQLPLTGIEVLVSKHGLDRHATTQAFGCIGFETLCSHFLNSHPEMLSQLVVQQTESANEYFGHVVRYYGQLQCLDDAMQAVIAQVQTNLCPQSGPSDRDILVKYGKALRSLQEAINGSLWDGPEVLCATQLLALFEVLHSKGLERWRGHIQGAAKLMRLRGPGRHRTDFDINLFLNLYPAICCESFMKCQPCLFVGPEWQGFVEDIMDHDRPFAERGRLNLNSAKLLFKAVDSIPTLMSLLIEQAEPDDPRVLKVTADLHQTLQEYVAWFDDFNVCLRKLAEKDSNWSSNEQLRITYGSGTMTYMLFCRLFAVFAPSERAQYEQMSQIRAGELLQLVASVSADDHRQKLLMRQKKNLAMGVLMTAQDWEEQTYSGKLIDLDTFLRWCQIIGDSSHREFGDLTVDGGFIRYSKREMARLLSGRAGIAKEVNAVTVPALPDTFQYWEWGGDGEE